MLLYLSKLLAELADKAQGLNLNFNNAYLKYFCQFRQISWMSCRVFLVALSAQILSLFVSQSLFYKTLSLSDILRNICFGLGYVSYHPLRRNVVWIFPRWVGKPQVGNNNFPISHEWQIGKIIKPHFSSVVVCHNYTVSVNLALIKLNLNHYCCVMTYYKFITQQ